jgi:hypothetical protein
MLNSRTVRRTLAVLGIGATAAAPFTPALLAMIAATAAPGVAAAKPDLPPWIIPPPVPGENPADTYDGTGGVGDTGDHDGGFDDGDTGDDEDGPAEDVHDGTGGVGGNLP